MMDVYEILRQKETDLSRVRREVDSLRMAIPLLSDEEENEAEQTTQPFSEEATGTGGPISGGGTFEIKS